MILIFGFMHDLQLHVPELYYLAFKFFMEKWFQNLRLIKYTPLSNGLEMNTFPHPTLGRLNKGFTISGDFPKQPLSVK